MTDTVDDILEEKSIFGDEVDTSSSSEVGGDGPYYNAAVDYARNIFAGSALYDVGTNKCHCTLEDRNVSNLVYRMIESVCPKTLNFHNVTTKTKGQYLRKYLSKTGRSPIPPRHVEEPVKSNIDILCSLADLNGVQKKVLTFFAVLADTYGLREIGEMFGYLRKPMLESIVSVATCLSKKDISDALSDSSRLVSCGLLHIDDSSGYLHGKVRIAGDIRDVLSAGKLTSQKLLSHYLSKLGKTSLTWSDFTHIDSSIVFAKAILKSAIERKQQGINILFYGETGTGKTELAKLLAQELGVDAYVANTDSGGEAGVARVGCDPVASDRIASLHAGQWLLKNGSSLLLFDEMEDLFQRSSFDLGLFGRADAKLSKQGFNSVLERNPMPTIWTTNNINGVDAAFIRRFTYAIEFKPLEAKHRARIIKRYLVEGELTDEEVNKLAEKFSVSPAQISNAVNVARLTSQTGKPSASDIECVLGSIEKSINNSSGNKNSKESKSDFDVSSYSLAALNTSDNLEQIANRLVDWKQVGNAGVSMCLYGPTGTGKSEFVKYLANRMQKEVVIKRASDILSMWVGGSEQNIAASFKEAEEKKAILLFDEVDSFLQDRSRAFRSWEVTQVNEFLQQMEVFKGLVICTTNLFEGIDAASLRRFIFKIRFNYPTNEQCVGLFKMILADCCTKESFSNEDIAQIKSGLSGLYGLSPGDFAAIRRKEKSLGRKQDIGMLVSSLKEEVDAKHLFQPRNIGFNK